MMKLTVIFLLGLIGIAIALHGTGAYGYNGGGGHKHHKSSESSSSSESEEFIKPKVCKHECSNKDTFDFKTDGAQDTRDCLDTEDDCSGCCHAWAFSRGVTILEGLYIYSTSPDKCRCCIRKCS